MRERLGLEAESVSGPELVRAVLRMEVDLLWNGGVGTYVKASSETAEAAGDRANDAVRIDANQLRARVVGEGGNLGLTQAGRVEASLRGVRMDTDAIDNSAGVDLSDHEVNYKLALAPLVRSGRLQPDERRELLFSVADEACEAAKAHNRGQALALSLDERRSRRAVEPFLRAVDSLCEFAGLAPKELDLPDAAVASERAGQGIGFTRPELAVLLGLAKLQLLAELAESDVASSDYVEDAYLGYFPKRFREDQLDALRTHRLKPEIGALRLVNRLVDAGGATLLPTLMAELGVGAPEVASAVLLAEDLLRIPDYRQQLLGLANASREGVFGALIEIDEGVREVARYLVRCGAHGLDKGRAERWRVGLDALRDSLGDFLSDGEAQRLNAGRDRLERRGLPTDLARDVATLPLADRGLNVLRICERSPVAPIEAARAYAKLGDQTGINWLYNRLSLAQSGSLWDDMVLVDLRWDLLDLQREITEAVLASKPDDLDAATEEFLEDHASELDLVRNLQRRAAADATPSALAVITSRLRSLRQAEVEDSAE
jgi:glutamate dehydrogenase